MLQDWQKIESVERAIDLVVHTLRRGRFSARDYTYMYQHNVIYQWNIFHTGLAGTKYQTLFPPGIPLNDFFHFIVQRPFKEKHVVHTSIRNSMN